MASGIILPSLLTIATSTSEGLIIGQRLSQQSVSISPNGPWTPPQYSSPATTILTVPTTGKNSTTGQTQTSSSIYVFDAVFKTLHHRVAHKTSHPVLTGANISDHIYMEPSKVTLEIGMSDVMASFTSGVWVGFSTKSISAWQILKSIQINKSLVTLTTKLDTYSNMLIIDMIAPDNNKTKFALKATIIFEELLSASVASTPSSSARPQSSGSTPTGTVQSTAPNSSQTQQNVIPSPLYPGANTFPNVPGAGNVSSNSLSNATP
jgi:hypothetical protein